MRTMSLLSLPGNTENPSVVCGGVKNIVRLISETDADLIADGAFVASEVYVGRGSSVGMGKGKDKGKGKGKGKDKGKGKVAENIEKGKGKDNGKGKEGSEDGKGKKGWTAVVEKFRSEIEMSNPKFRIGMIFSTSRILKEALEHHKGLIQALGEIFSKAEHMRCVRHMHNNFKKLHAGNTLKDQLWKCARATHQNRYDDCMKALKALDDKAHE
ncbi:hypothetical protein M9H77_34903 [Catharanthus roseus]|uniref:Uncharacterized protein n=1 Tax=Catharanthus roseus TaxID=4058 RepID=A0ACB9ZN73_CATRO|nr:hypothetical protein M9H77_34903 [Catharanthus roseus]